MHPHIVVTIPPNCQTDAVTRIRIYDVDCVTNVMTLVTQHEYSIGDALPEIPSNAAEQYVALALAAIAVEMAEVHGKKFLQFVSDAVADVHDT